MIVEKSGQSQECTGHFFARLHTAIYSANRRPGESRDPVGAAKTWIPAFAGMSAKPGLAACRT